MRLTSLVWVVRVAMTSVSSSRWSRTVVRTSGQGSPVGIVLGGETNGISPEVIDLLSLSVRIPMAADVESLNVAAAAAVVCFELTRRSFGHRRTGAAH